MAADSDSEQEPDYHVVSKDAVPAPALRPASAWSEQVATIQQWLHPTDYNSPGNEYMKHLHSYVPGTGAWVRASPTFGTHTACWQPGTATYDDHDDPHTSHQEINRREQVMQDMQLTYPLLAYAVENLTYHVKNTEPEDEKVSDALATLLVPGKPAFGVWMYYKWRSRLCSTFGAAHLATVAGMPLYIIEHLAPSGADTQDGDGRTPLSYAAEKGHAEAAKFFLEHGADPKSDDRFGYTPLHYAASEGHFDTVQSLLKTGVGPLIGTTKPKPYNVYFNDTTYGETALEFACKGDHADIITLFMPLIPTDDVNRCFHWVNGVKNLEAILKTGHANVDCFAGGKTKLFEAAGNHDLEAMQVLLEYGADPNKRCSGERWNDVDTITLEVDSPRGPMPIHAFAGSDDQAPFISDDNAKKCLQLLLDRGASVNATNDGEGFGARRDDGNLTALFYAVQKRSSDRDFSSWVSCDEDETGHELASMLLDFGADPNARSTLGNTPVHYANPESPALLDVLVAHSADVNAKNNLGKTPLLELMRQYRTKPNMKVFEKLIECGADVNVSDMNGNTICHHIISYLEKFEYEDLLFLQSVIRSGLDLNKKNNNGKPPLMMYRQSSSWDGQKRDDEPLLQALVDSGMDINARSDDGKTLLWEHVESYDANIETAEKLVRLGADVMVRAEDGNTLLHCAINSQRSIELVRFLASKGIDPSVKDAEGSTLVHLAMRAHLAQKMYSVSSSSYDTRAGRAMIDSLLEFGISPEEKDGLGRTALHLASLSPPIQRSPREDDEHWIDVVLKTPMFGAKDVNVRDNDGATPLHYAASVSEFTVAKLLRAGADPTCLTLEGVSPLHIACLARQPNIVGLLLATYKEQGNLEQLVNLHDISGAQRTSLHVAARSGVPESVVYLLANGADVAAIDRNGFTPLHALAEFPLEHALWDEKREFIVRCKGMIKLDDETRPEKVTWIDHATNELETLELLLEAGVDVDAKAVFEQRDLTALDLATKNNCRTVVQELLRRGDGAQDASIAQLGEDEKLTEAVQALLEVKDSDQVFAKLVEALQKHEYTTIKEFVRLGGNILAANERRDTMLHKMVNLGCTSLLDYFEDEASQVDQQPWMKEEDDPGTLLGEACERRLPSLHIIKHLVEKTGLNVNAPPHRYRATNKLAEATPLHFVACGEYFWHAEAVAYLLAQGADIEAKNAHGQTPLLCAVSTEHPNGFWKEETIKVLLDHGADPNVVGKAELLCLEAVELSCLEAADDARVLKLLLEHGADIAANPRIIERAVDRMDVAMVQVLVDAGADPNCPAKTLAIEASIEDAEEDEKDDAEDDESNSKAGKEESKSKKVTLPDAAEQPRNPLHSAARPSTKERIAPDWDIRRQLVTEALLRHGANPYAFYADGRYVLQAIVEEQGILAPFLALENLDIEKTGWHGRTLLLSACVPARKPHPRSWRDEDEKNFPATANTEAILALLERGAVPNVVDDQGRTPLHCLCTMTHPYDEDHQKAFAALVARDVSLIQTVDNMGFKPLHRALQSSQAWAVQHLLTHGADPKEADPDGNTALHFLAHKLVGEKASATMAQTEFKRLVQQCSLDVNARNNKGETPLLLCMAADWTGTRDPTHVESHPEYALANDVAPSDVLGFLVDAGADVFTADGDGRTLLHAAAGRRVEEPWSNQDQIQHVESVFKKLMGMGLDPTREDASLRTPIDVAVARGRKGIVGLFAEKK